MIKTIRKKENFKYILIYALVIAFYQLVMKEYYGDTLAYFARAIPDMSVSSLMAELHSRYMSWTSRVLIEVPLFILAHGMHMVLFGIANWIMHMMLLLSMMYLTNYKHNRVLVCLMLIYPVALMAGSGWMTAYITYFWPLACGITAFVSLKKMYLGEKLSVLQVIFFTLCLVFAVDLEVCAVFYTCILCTFIVMMIWEKHFDFQKIVYTVCQLLICACGIVFALTCPGNEARKISNIAYWFPNYTSFTVVDKAVLGVNSAFLNLYSNDIFWIMLCANVCLLSILFGKKDVKKTVVASTPLLLALLMTVLKPVLGLYYPEMVSLFDLFANKKYVDATNYNSLAVYIPFIIFMISAVALLLAIIELFEYEKKAFFACAVIVSGIMSRLTLGFSPTVFASGKRTFIFLDFAIIYILVYLSEEYGARVKARSGAVAILRALMILMAFVAVVANVIAVCNVYLY
ncbi:hypothetical protein [Butyrivibrio hungatei]|uniref:Uncharacterized protein n=1 Tax=Butyrivibrio hungatei TaxID=185008 RepID=A0A1D9NYR6_9FIRM|nr:hypothetical protein [Butyrivibrio hungatei]AOZ95516.1 hypothetical protein bhn_I0482 [Butyrivibrio hungatei]